MTDKSILIADDDEMIRVLYSEAFSSAGIEVITATNGQECVDEALKHHPSIILVDIMMPIMSGHKAVDKIRQDEWGKSVKIVYLTNLSDAENVVHAVERKSDEYIVKANNSVKEVVNKVRLAMHS